MIQSSQGRTTPARASHVVASTLLVALGWLASGSAYAGFFIPKDVTMVMGSWTPGERTAEIAYGFTREVSGSIAFVRRFDAVHGGRHRERTDLVLGQAALLLVRHQLPDGIGNAYVYGGPLAARNARTEDTRYGVHGGLWADYETRWVYTRASWHGYRYAGRSRSETVLQAMLAPYAADYEDIASWGGVQLRKKTGQSQVEVTPYLRFFSKRWWIDAGVSVNRQNRNDLFVNLMFTF
ncbi:MAG: hypothetical protein N3F11_07230 [Casimicrobiaceae bacterium]|nr:hypothetical protein [Casimicrobiaceae bacterium]